MKQYRSQQLPQNSRMFYYLCQYPPLKYCLWVVLKINSCIYVLGDSIFHNGEWNDGPLLLFGRFSCHYLSLSTFYFGQNYFHRPYGRHHCPITLKLYVLLSQILCCKSLDHTWIIVRYEPHVTCKFICCMLLCTFQAKVTTC